MITGAVLLGVLLLLVWTVRSQQVSERQKLTGELALAAKKITVPQVEQLRQQKAALENRIATGTARAGAEAGKLFSTSQSIAATDMLIETAARFRAEVVEVKSAGPARENFQGAAVVALPLTVKVEGELEALADFAIALGEVFPASVIRSVEIDVPRPVGQVVAKPTAEAKPGKPSAVIQIVIYTYNSEGNG